MQTITLVTGNKGKLAEWRRLFPAKYNLQNADIDLEEIQSMDLDAIVLDKAKRAYEHIKGPVLVEDISAGLDKLQGLPGPFVKYFELKLGNDAMFQLAKIEGEPMTVDCAIGYYDGTRSLVVHGEVHGKVVSSRGDGGFGFDHVFIPAGQTKTYAQMTHAEKDAVSHRGKAIKKLLPKLLSL